MKNFIHNCGVITAAVAVFWLAAVSAFVYFTLGAVLGEAMRTLINGFVLFAQICGVMLLVGGAAVVGVIVWSKWSKRRNDNMRQLNGSMPAQWFTDNSGRKHFVSPSEIPGGSFVFDPERGVTPITLGLPPALAAIHIQTNNAVRFAQATFAGDDALMDIGEQVQEPKVPAAAMKPMSAKPSKIIDVEPEQIEAKVGVVMPSIEDGTRNNTARSFAIGHGDDGSVMRWASGVYPHLRWHGKSQGSGKTTGLKGLAASVLKSGGHVLILDRRRFKDWQDFKGRAEMIDTSNPYNFASAIMAVHAEFERRDRMLGEHSAPNIDALPGAKLPRVIVIVSEFGATWTDAQAEGIAEQIEKPLVDMARMSGATGIHICLEDQTPDKKVWPRALTANATPVAGYNEKMYGTLVGHDKPHQIEPYTFSLDGGEVFRTWDMNAPDARQFVAGLPELNGYRVFDPGLGDVRSPKPTETAPNTPPNAHRTPVPERTNTSNATEHADDGRDNAPKPTPTDPPFDVRSADKREAILWYIDNVGGTQAACRRWYADRGLTLSAGYTSDVYNGKFDNPQPEPAQTAYGDAEVIDMNTPEGRALASEFGKTLFGKDLKVS